MSVREKLAELRFQEQQQRLQQQQAIELQQELARQQRIQQQRDDEVKFRSGIYNATTEQIRLYKQLERAGLVSIVMEATGRKFFAPKMPLPLKEDGSFDTSQVKWPSAEVIREHFNHDGWQVRVEPPVLSGNDEWDTAVRMRLTQVHYGIMCGRQTRPVSSIDKVMIDYDDKRQLTIKGEDTTFEGLIKIQRTASQTDLLEMALARAIDKPEVERPNLKPHSLHRRSGLFGGRIIIGG